MFRKLFLLLLILTPLHLAYSDIPEDGVLGVSVFAVQSPNFQGAPCERARRIITRQELPTFSFLYETFGRDNTCLFSIWDEIIAQRKRHITQIHFSNEVGRRNDLTSPFDFFPELTIPEYNLLLEEMTPSVETTIRERVRDILNTIGNYGDTGTFILGTGLESDFSVRAYRNLYEILREEWPYIINRNPLRTTERRLENITADTYMEYHHYKRTRNMHSRCILNGDGQDLGFGPGTDTSLGGLDAAREINVTRWARNGSKNGCIMFLWIAKWQGLHKRNPPEPSRRRFLVDRSDLRTTSRLLNRLNRNRRRKAQFAGKKSRSKKRG